MTKNCIDCGRKIDIVNPRTKYCLPCKSLRGRLREKEYAKRKKEVYQIPIIEGKTRKCGKCQTFKPLAEFIKNKAKPLGHDYKCYPCNMTSDRHYRSIPLLEKLKKRAERKRMIAKESHNILSRKVHKQISQFTIHGEYLKTFKDIKDASAQTKITSNNIYRALKGNRFSAGGYIWEYRNSNLQSGIALCQCCGKPTETDLTVNISLSCLQRLKMPFRASQEL